MWRLFQYPLCPFSRKVRFACAVKAVPVELVLEKPWERRDEFAALNPAGQTPVMQKGEITLIDSAAICDYFEETVDRVPLLGSGPEDRAEARRLIAWFDQKFYAEVTAPLLSERMYKRLYSKQAPDAGAVRTASRNAEGHLDYLDFLLDRRRWLSGPAFGLADIAAAAQISVADYLGGIDWDGHEPARIWYSALKSRPTFRPLLAERMEGLPPPSHYDKLDF
ncbi:glutathione S-transferase family protein [Polymorphobacter fuscus]|uniref:Glutathione S-transferase family protein n=1 Tax=Sandarakinorhabdus fusca TaxID=1439888 RepID=A0A7C9KNH2_9SPHN|nr:glutathione S-transferase family protein [Polymorphobacter fuscus]KAB7646500.1 glutathione S-transferase family protein [Polymorphobacter fuscus]MQT17744.1 glutathione S-transferase family protein [Polymorphobacter fuscus]NJC09708.1 glutathione S-transferase [Polymorphobacter fuscus]